MRHWTASGITSSPTRNRARAVELHSTQPHVVIPLKIGSKLDAAQPNVQKLRVGNVENRSFWTKDLMVRDREAPGSNPVPRPVFEFEPFFDSAAVLV
jgi:hypothetical protein